MQKQTKRLAGSCQGRCSQHIQRRIEALKIKLIESGIQERNPYDFAWACKALDEITWKEQFNA